MRYVPSSHWISNSRCSCKARRFFGGTLIRNASRETVGPARTQGIYSARPDGTDPRAEWARRSIGPRRKGVNSRRFCAQQVKQTSVASLSRAIGQSEAKPLLPSPLAGEGPRVRGGVDEALARPNA